MRKEEQLNTMDSFCNGFRIVRDGKVITLTPEEMFKDLGYECKYSKQRISYAKTGYRTITLIVFDLKAKQAYCECGMGLRAFSSEEDKAVQQQKKELGWLEKEI